MINLTGHNLLSKLKKEGILPKNTTERILQIYDNNQSIENIDDILDEVIESVVMAIKNITLYEKFEPIKMNKKFTKRVKNYIKANINNNITDNKKINKILLNNSINMLVNIIFTEFGCLEDKEKNIILTNILKRTMLENAIDLEFRKDYCNNIINNKNIIGLFKIASEKNDFKTIFDFINILINNKSIFKKNSPETEECIDIALDTIIDNKLRIQNKILMIEFFKKIIDYNNNIKANIEYNCLLLQNNNTIEVKEYGIKQLKEYGFDPDLNKITNINLLYDFAYTVKDYIDKIKDFNIIVIGNIIPKIIKIDGSLNNMYKIYDFCSGNKSLENNLGFYFYKMFLKETNNKNMENYNNKRKEIFNKEMTDSERILSLKKLVDEDEEKNKFFVYDLADLLCKNNRILKKEEKIIYLKMAANIGHKKAIEEIEKYKKIIKIETKKQRKTFEKINLSKDELIKSFEFNKLYLSTSFF